MNLLPEKYIQKVYVVLLFIIISISGGCKKNTSTSGGTRPPETPPPSTGKTFNNPLLSSAPDPYVIKKDSFYYYSCTLGNRIGIRKTTAMSKLPYISYVTVYSPAVKGTHSENIWAPEFYFINNKWYLYYTAGGGDDATQRLWVLESSNPDPTLGSWTDKGKINVPFDMWSIDGTILELNGNIYLLWSGRPDINVQNQNIYISKMSDPWTLEGTATLLSRPELSWETNGAVNEGPEILKNPQGKVFLIYSASGCWTDEYALGMLSLKDGGDPLNGNDWTKSSAPVFTKSTSNSVYAPGHNSFFKSRDGSEDWIIYHANPEPENNNGCGPTRSTRMQKFTWKSDGTPDFGVPVSTFTALKVPSGE